MRLLYQFILFHRCVMLGCSFFTTSKSKINYLQSCANQNQNQKRSLLLVKSVVNNSSGKWTRKSPPNARNSKKNLMRQMPLSKRSPKIQILPDPPIVFTNNHLVVVNKPAGYHSQPNESPSMGNNQKCLLTKLKSMQVGGGSANNFLLPMHRLDQPCTGILLLAKTSKAGTRVGKIFNKHLVEKEYFCVVSGDLKNMKRRSKKMKESSYKVSGILAQSNRSTAGGNSVVYMPIPKDRGSIDGRICHLEWRHILSVSKAKNIHLISVRTDTGAKHQIRAMLAQIVKSPICGDLRYGAKESLPDKSVALHARTLSLPTLQLGDTDFKNKIFTAPIPKQWEKYFALGESMIQKQLF